MTHYAILRNPGHNQVYFHNSLPLAQAELTICPLSLENISEKKFGGLSYLTFSTKEPLQEEALEKISLLSFVYGLFQVEGDCLRPLILPDIQVLDRSLGTILKYPGKTNEIFTRFLLNIALFEGNFNPKEIKVLDPVAGRGTSLFEAFSLGSDVYGLEIQEKSVSEGYQHLKKFLEKEKRKHKTKTIRFSGENKSFTAKRYQIDCGTQHFEMVSGDNKYLDQVFSQENFHIILGDLPYGVKHGNQATGLSRNPSQMLQSMGRKCHKVLKKGGILVFSWNTFVLSREKMEESLQKSGFTLVENPNLQSLEHKVDASILRDIIVAKKV